MLSTRTARFLAGALALGALQLQPSVNAQATVHSGWDLLVTVPSETEFMGQNWEGVPIGLTTLPGVGTVDVGIADTIMHRPADATGIPGGLPAFVPLEIVALQLKSLNPFDPDGGGSAPLGTYYLTLSGAASVGVVAIGFDLPPSSGGTFDNGFLVPWKMTLGAPNGPVVAQGIEGLQLDGIGYWGREKVSPTGGVPLIPGVNYLLNGTDTSEDFHLAFDPNAAPGEPGGHGGIPSGPHARADDPWLRHLQLSGYDPAKHGVTECPEPSDWLLLSAVGLGGFALYRRTRRA